MIEPTRITTLLHEIDAGRQGASEELMELVYADLENVARHHLKQRFGAGADRLTMEPAALVNESFLRLVRQQQGFENRGHFFAIATRVMLRVLVDYCRHRNASKRGGGRTRISITFHDDEGVSRSDTGQIDVESLTDAVDALEALDARKADVVRMRVIWGLQHEAIAEALGVSIPTVERDWRFARAWLATRVNEGAVNEGAVNEGAVVEGAVVEGPSPETTNETPKS